MWQEFLQDRISAAVGASVSFDKLSVSPFRGIVDGRGLVARMDDAATQFLTIERVQLKVKMAELLAKRLAVEMVLLERPAVVIERNADGKFNLPPMPTKKPKADGPPAGESRGGGSSWAAGIRQVVMTDGSVRYFDQSPGFDGYAAEAGPMNLQIDQPASGPATITGNIAGIRRMDKPADVGSLLVMGEGSGLEQLTDLHSLTGRVTVALKDLLNVELDATPAEFRATIRAHLTSVGLLPMLPAAWMEQIPSLMLKAKSDLNLTVALDRE